MADRTSWWLKTSSSEIDRSKSKTWRYSRSIRPTSRFPNTPVQSAQCTFLRVESFRYCAKWLARYKKGARERTYLASNDERAKENTFAGPLLECNLEVGLGAVDVHESDQERRDRHLCASEDIGHKGGERAVVGVAREGPPTLRRGRTPHCIVDCVCHSVDDILCGLGCE